ncbi:hypothetical protein CM49_04458 [Paenibacillus sp. P1XP2]|nr:hypothetical protein CM49_04458 [Paenibacillus sp. P1XP2]
MIGAVEAGAVVKAGLFYLLWLWFAGALTLLVSSLLDPAPGIAFVSLGAALLLSMASGWLPRYTVYSPGSLPQISAQWLEPRAKRRAPLARPSVLGMYLYFFRSRGVSNKVKVFKRIIYLTMLVAERSKTSLSIRPGL